MREYAFIHPDPLLKDNLMAFGFEMDSGWFPIMIELCDKIQDLITLNPEKYREFKFVQVKEKFGTLRVYCSCYNDEISDLIDEAEEKASITCESCGAEGRMTYVHGWYKTLCNNCAEKHELG